MKILQDVSCYDVHQEVVSLINIPVQTVREKFLNTFNWKLKEGKKKIINGHRKPLFSRKIAIELKLGSTFV